MPRRVTSRLVLPGFACCYHITQRHRGVCVMLYIAYKHVMLLYYAQM